MSDNNNPKDNHYLGYGVGFGLILGTLVGGNVYQYNQWN